MERSGPRVLTLPAAAPALPALVEAVLDGEVLEGRRFRDDPLSLVGLTLLLPTRRAVRTAEAAFLAALGGEAVLLPRLKALPEIDEAELAFAEAAGELDLDPASTFDLPQAVAPLDRRFALMRLVMALMRNLGEEEASFAAGPAEAAHLAGALARLLDNAALEDVDWSRLDAILPEGLDPYFETSARFLKIATRAWPDHLESIGLADGGARHVALIERERQRIAAGQAGPVVAVAASGTAPVLARLLAAIARAPDGAVVLPGLDQDLDAESWRIVAGDDEREAAANHPQHGLAALLAALGVERRDVVPLPAPPQAASRARLLSEALRPAETSDVWSGAAALVDKAAMDVSGLVLVEAETDQDEALAIALCMREAVETPGRTAALVTPDRTLARRVSGELARWGLRIDDSAGQPLALTPPAIFARLVADAVAASLAPVPLLALLKHPLAGFGLERGTLRRAVLALERAVLRGPRPESGCSGLHAALQAVPADIEAGRRRILLSGEEFAASVDLVERVTQALAPLAELDAHAPQPLRDLVARHLDTCHRVAENPAGDTLFAGEAGEALAAYFVDLLEAEGQGLTLRLAEYPALFGTLAAERAVRPRAASHPRLSIWGPLEARLQSVDRLVLGGLNERIWPREVEPDPWLNRAMRSALGLPQPERRVGLAAHDFVGAFASLEVILTRARRSGGDPTVPSRFLQRLETVLGPDAIGAMRMAGAKYADWTGAIDLPSLVTPCPRPEPRPPVAVRPRKLSVTEIEDWVRDPYTIYARHVLKLRPLDALDAAPDAAARGTAIHEAIAQVLRDGTWPDDALYRLLRAGDALFEPHRRHPSVQAFWWPRFERMARWFVTLETSRRAGLSHVAAEVSGEIVFDAPGGAFTLRGRADRIDLTLEGRLAVHDFKTGQPPSGREVRLNFSPQITLVGGMARAGAFAEGHRGADLAELGFVYLKGGEPAGLVTLMRWDDATLDEAADAALKQLAGLVAAFDRAEQPYHSVPRPKWKSRYGDYDHLARIREWSLTGGEGDES